MRNTSETDPNATVSISVADGATPSVIHFDNADATVALTIGSGAAAVDLAVVGTFDLSVQSTASGPFALEVAGEGISASLAGPIFLLARRSRSTAAWPISPTT
ncbi:MAG TPA: hypothetical protein VFE24_11260 [Pirellulales bacterium]|jgi:hypothetical protein|nr:hypothetical protein [Pirellulales bacterium]